MKLSKEFIANFREEAKKAQWEINRWNGKSIDDLVVDYLEHKELKPEDFKDVVVLTIEEAKQIDAAMTYLYMNSDVERRYADIINKLIYRIEQTKNCDSIKYLKHEIDQLKKEQAKDNWLKNQFLETVEQEKERKLMNFNNEKKTHLNINSQLTLNEKEVKIIYTLLEEFTDTMNTSEYKVYKKLEKHLYEPKQDNDYDIEIECEIQNL